MKRIEVSTSHNITIRFELASLTQRVLATFIDFIFLFFVFSFLMRILPDSMFLQLLVVFFLSFYHLAFEMFNKGQSLGKKLLKIRVISLEGRIAKLNDYFIRWAFRGIDIIPSLGLIGIVSIFSSEKSQRLGDLLANTAVIKQQNEDSVQLASIQKLEVDGEIMYPALAQYNDSDMLLVKEALNRYARNPHTENKLVIDELTKKIADQLMIDPKKVRPVKFLKRVLYDYVLLTR